MTDISGNTDTTSVTSKDSFAVQPDFPKGLEDKYFCILCSREGCGFCKFYENE
jgi:hypothetical protein